MSTTAIASTSQTVTNLLAAYEGESNASVKYTAFAIRAEVEGYFRVAALFRAAARAEQVHAAHHARILTKLGAVPTATFHEFAVRTTAVNLATAKAGEEYERDLMYADFIKEAEAAGQKDAVRTFTLASKAENVHAQLYGEALANLEAQRVKTTFYVCLHCGEVSDKPEDAESCPICGAKVEMFEKVR